MLNSFRKKISNLWNKEIRIPQMESVYKSDFMESIYKTDFSDFYNRELVSNDELTRLGLHIRRLGRLGFYGYIDYFLCHVDLSANTEILTIVLKSTVIMKKEGMISQWEYGFNRIRNELIRRYKNEELVDNLLLYKLND